MNAKGQSKGVLALGAAIVLGVGIGYMLFKRPIQPDRIARDSVPQEMPGERAPVEAVPSSEDSAALDALLPNRPFAAPTWLRADWQSSLGNDFTVRLVTQEGYEPLYHFLNGLPDDLSIAEIADLLDLLRLPSEAFGHMDPLERFALANEIMNTLIRQQRATDATAYEISRLVTDPALDPVLRNYALQFTYLLRENDEFGISISDDRFEEVRSLVYRNPHGHVAGVAMLGDLRHLRNHREGSASIALKEQLLNLAQECLSVDPSTSENNRATAIHILLELGHGSLSETVSEVLSPSSTDQPSARLAAIHAVVSSELTSEIDSLIRIAADESEIFLVREAANHAVNNLNGSNDPLRNIAPSDES